MKNTVKITAGSLRGRQITTPGGKTHPMGERERLALFNMILGYIPGSSVLDAFSGSGALGIEAISRGAKRVVFVEKDPKAMATIKQNLSSLDIDTEGAELILGDVYRVIPTMKDQFELVLADPPYDDYDPIAIRILAQMVTRTNGILVLSHPGAAPEMPGLTLQKSRTYSGATISIYGVIA